MRSRCGLLLSALVGAAVLVTIPGGGARAAVSTLPRLAVSGVTQFLADGLHGHLFLNSAGSVVVTDFDGRLVTRLDRGNGAAGMIMSGDGRALYVALRRSRAVAVISTVTLRQTALYRLGAGNVPSGVAVVGNRLWVSYTGAHAKAAVGYFTLVPRTPKFVPAALPGPAWAKAPRLAADPLGEGVLVAVDAVAQPRKIASYEVLGPEPTVLAESSRFSGCRSFADMAVSPGGKQLILACGGESGDHRYATATLKAAGAYPAGALPDAVATALDGSVAAGTGKPDSRQLSVYHPGWKTPTNAFRFGGEIVAPGGLAWTSDSTKLFAVLEPKSGGAYYLDEFGWPQFKTTTIKIGGNDTASVLVTHKVRLSGTLRFGSRPAPSGITVTIIRTVKGSPARISLTVRTKAGGIFAASDIPQARGSYFYTAYYASNGIQEPAWHTTFVTVTPLHTTLSVTASPGTASPGTKVWVVAHLGTTYRNRTVSVYEEPAAGGKRKLLRTGRVGAKGNLGVKFSVTQSTTFIAVFTGDAHYAPVSAEATVTVQP